MSVESSQQNFSVGNDNDVIVVSTESSTDDWHEVILHPPILVSTTREMLSPVIQSFTQAVSDLIKTLQTYQDQFI